MRSRFMTHEGTLTVMTSGQRADQACNLRCKKSMLIQSADLCFALLTKAAH